MRAECYERVLRQYRCERSEVPAKRRNSIATAGSALRPFCRLWTARTRAHGLEGAAGRRSGRHGVKTASPRAWGWAALRHRAFGIDVLACAHCGGRLRLIATLHDPRVIRKRLGHLALGPSGQSPGPAPPESGAGAP